jgi:transcription elongation factor Elf1
MRDKILESLYEIFDKQTNSIININNKQLIYNCCKYSSKKENYWHIQINDIILKKNSNLIIKYKCYTCNTDNFISTTQFIRKINKCSIACPSCNIIKLNSIQYNKSIKINIIENKTLIDKYKESIELFNNYPDDFKNSYLLNHLTEEDYIRIKPKIIGFCNNNKNDIDNYEFWSIFKTNNQQHFTSILYDKINNAVFPIDQPILKCENCYKNWRAKNIVQFKNAFKILCADCKLCNKTFKIRPINNLLNETIIYQSKLELKFIKWCHDEGIILNNGPYIKYFFGDKEKTYRVDFRIGNNIIIEIKDFHIWHKNQVTSGLWDVKINAVNLYNSINKTIYYFIYPANWNQKIKELKNNILPDCYIYSRI